MTITYALAHVICECGHRMYQNADGAWTCINPRCAQRGRMFDPICRFEERVNADPIEEEALTG